MKEWISCIFLLMGLIFVVISALGVVRMPDFYSRLHASGMGETWGILSIFVGLAIYTGWELTSLKLLLVPLMMFLDNPIGTHSITNAAYKRGYDFWKKPEEKEE